MPGADGPAGAPAPGSTPAGKAGVSVSPRRAASASYRRPGASPRERRIAEAGVLVTVAIWSANFVVVKAAVTVLGPLTFTSARYVVAAITLFLLSAR